MGSRMSVEFSVVFAMTCGYKSPHFNGVIKYIVLFLCIVVTIANLPAEEWVGARGDECQGTPL